MPHSMPARDRDSQTTMAR